MSADPDPNAAPTKEILTESNNATMQSTGQSTTAETPQQAP